MESPEAPPACGPRGKGTASALPTRHTHTHAHAYSHTNTRTHTHEKTQTNTRTYSHTHTHMHRHTLTYAHTRSQTRTHKQKPHAVCPHRSRASHTSGSNTPPPHPATVRASRASASGSFSAAAAAASGAGAGTAPEDPAHSVRWLERHDNNPVTDAISLDLRGVLASSGGSGGGSGGGGGVFGLSVAYDGLGCSALDSHVGGALRPATHVSVSRDCDRHRQPCADMSASVCVCFRAIRVGGPHRTTFSRCRGMRGIACTIGLHTRMYIYGCTACICTACMHSMDAQHGCTAWMHTMDAQHGCTAGTSRRTKTARRPHRELRAARAHSAALAMMEPSSAAAHAHL